MTTTTSAVRTGQRSAVFILRIVVVALTLTTAVIHARLGGLLFTLNAIGYLVLAVAMVLPGPVTRVRWLARLALIGFTAATIGGWVLFGARFPLAYLDKAVELVLIAFLTFEVWLDGGPAEIIRRLRRVASAARDIRTRA
jgi:hypothetical protein